MITDLAYPADQKADRQALCFIRLATGHAIKKKKCIWADVRFTEVHLRKLALTEFNIHILATWLDFYWMHVISSSHVEDSNWPNATLSLIFFYIFTFSLNGSVSLLKAQGFTYYSQTHHHWTSITWAKVTFCWITIIWAKVTYPSNCLANLILSVESREDGGPWV